MSGAVIGYYVWLKPKNSPGETSDGPVVGMRVEPDPIYEEHLDFLGHHPSFIAALAELGESPDQAHVESVAAKWELTPAHVREFASAAASGQESVELDPEGGLVYVELQPTEYVLHVPRPLPPERREVIIRWAREVWKWPKAIGGGRLATQKSGHPAHQARHRLEWYDRWNAGESPHAIWDSLPPEMALMINEWGVRNTLQQIHRRMREISPQGLRTPGP